MIRNNKIVGSDFGTGCFSGIDFVEDPTTRAHISKNVITGCDFGIFAYADLPTTKLKISKNDVSANHEGITLNNIRDSRISANRAHLNERGILLLEDSTGNAITKNEVTGNGDVDLIHDVGSSPNIWIDNTCGTSIGADIDCP
jgi:parallel beta-helix repeat protein